MVQTYEARTPGSLGQVLLVAGWFGLLAGLVEGIALLLIQEIGGGTWEAARWPVHVKIIWITTFFSFFLYLLVGLAAAAAGRILPRVSPLAAVVFACGFLAFFDWLGLTQRMRLIGVAFLSAGLATVVSRWYRRDPQGAWRLWRGSFPWLAAVAVLALAGIQSGLWIQERIAVRRLAPARANSPNVLVIVIDTLRADHLSAYGYPRATSPHLDRVASQGVLFETAFSTSSWTLPSHVSLLNGRYPYEHGPRLTHMDERFPTLPEVLAGRGYRTGAFSANTLVFTREKFGRGFHRFEDIFQSLADMAVRTFYGRKFDLLVLKYLLDDHPGRKRAADITSAVLGWVDGDRERPFFAFLNYFDPHVPYIPPEPYRNRFSKLGNAGHSLRRARLSEDPQLTAEETQGEVDGYDGAIAYVDEHIGRLLAGLAERGLERNTLVVITSDHGEAFGEHGMFLHRNSLYREVVHVPLIFRWPGHVPEGVRIAQPVSNAGVPATAMDLLGEGDQTAFPGPSLALLWKQPGDHPDWPMPLVEIEQLPFEEVKRLPVYHGWIKSLISPQWHYIRHQKLGDELYDWAGDPREKQNLARTPEGQRISAEFGARLQALLTGPRKAALAEGRGAGR